MLICNQQTLITKSPTDNKEQSKFLGYEWSNRKGSEGIKYLNFPNSNDEDEDEITETSKALQSINTALYDPNENPNDEQTLNPNKLNFWIRQNFIQAIQKDTANLSGSLKNSEASKYAQMVYLRDCIDFKKAEFDLAINLSAQSKIEIESKYPLVKLDSVLLFIRNGKNVNQIDEVGKYKVARIETIANAIVDTNAVKYTNDEVSNEHFFDYGDIILSHINSLKHLGNVRTTRADSLVSPLHSQETVEAVERCILDYRRLESLCGAFAGASIPLSLPFPLDAEGAEQLADRVRKLLGLGDSIVLDYVSVLEAHGVRVLFLPLGRGIESLSFYDARSASAFVVLSEETTTEKQLFRMALELAWIYLYTRGGATAPVPEAAEATDQTARQIVE